MTVVVVVGRERVELGHACDCLGRNWGAFGGRRGRFRLVVYSAWGMEGGGYDGWEA